MISTKIVYIGASSQVTGLNPLSTEVMISTRQISMLARSVKLVSILYLPRLWFLLYEEQQIVVRLLSVSILYLPRLWFLPLEWYYRRRGTVWSQSSIYRGYDFYNWSYKSRASGCYSLNPLSTEVMISTFLTVCGHDIAVRVSILYLPRLWFLLDEWVCWYYATNLSQSSIYRGYDFYKGECVTNTSANRGLNPLSTEVMISTHRRGNRLGDLHLVSILYLPRLWFLLAPIFTPSVLRVKGQLR